MAGSYRASRRRQLGSSVTLSPRVRSLPRSTAPRVFILVHAPASTIRSKRHHFRVDDYLPPSKLAWELCQGNRLATHFSRSARPRDQIRKCPELAKDPLFHGGHQLSTVRYWLSTYHPQAATQAPMACLHIVSTGLIWTLRTDIPTAAPTSQKNSTWWAGGDDVTLGRSPDRSGRPRLCHRDRSSRRYCGGDTAGGVFRRSRTAGAGLFLW